MPVVQEHIVTSPFGSPQVPQITVWEFLRPKLESYGDKQAVVDIATGREFTFQEILTLSTSVARGLLHHGYKRNQIVTIYSPNCVEYYITLFAVWQLGGTVACLNALLTQDEIRHELDLMGSSMIISHNLTVHNSIIASSGTKVKTNIIIGSFPGCISFSSLCKPDLTWPNVLPSKHDSEVLGDTIPLMMFSSGTTGLPKGVMMTHVNLIGLALGLGFPGVELLSDSPTLLYQPMSHVYATGIIMGTTAIGSPLLIIQKFDLEEYAKLLVKYKCNLINFVPPIALLFSKTQVPRRYDLSRVDTLFSGAAPLPQEVIEDLLKQMNNKVQFRQGYGLTETSALATITPHAKSGYELSPNDSVGVCAPGVKIKIIDIESGTALQAGQTGEILVYSDYMLMKGYYKNPESTRNTIDTEGWLHTGDLGHFDEKGNIYVTDRLKELIKYKGYQVSPSELEALLLTHPAINDCGVTGIPDEVGGEVPIAWVVLKDTHQQVTEADIQNFVKDKAAPYKHLRGGVVFVTSIPKSPSGKILRREIKKMALQKIAKL